MKNQTAPNPKYHRPAMLVPPPPPSARAGRSKQKGLVVKTPVPAAPAPEPVMEVYTGRGLWEQVSTTTTAWVSAQEAVKLQQFREAMMHYFWRDLNHYHNTGFLSLEAAKQKRFMKADHGNYASLLDFSVLKTNTP